MLVHLKEFVKSLSETQSSVIYGELLCVMCSGLQHCLTEGMKFVQLSTSGLLFLLKHEKCLVKEPL